MVERCEVSTLGRWFKSSLGATMKYSWKVTFYDADRRSYSVTYHDLTLVELCSYIEHEMINYGSTTFKVTQIATNEQRDK